jgi:8-oxo-dGTP pyrophosphatase MutT (NUDIX family)
MNLPIGVQRICFRVAYNLLRLHWFVFRPYHEGVKCVLTDGNRVLLVRHTYGPDVWEVPGGSLGRREEPRTGATREVQEELGVSVSDWAPAGYIDGHMDYRHDFLYCFRAEIGSPPLSLALGEIATARWFEFDQLPPDIGTASGTMLRHLADSAPA